MRYWIGLFLVSAVFTLFAGTLSCSVVTAAACTGGTNTIVLRLSDSTNAHAELPSESTANYANTVVCCSGVSGLGTECSGTFATILKLSGSTNAHGEKNTESNYGTSACISTPSGGSVTIWYRTNNCNSYDTIIGSISATTNAHIGDGSAYTNKICATALGAGGLSVDIVDSGGIPVSSPSVALSATSLSLQYQSTSGTLGIPSEKIRITNTTGNAQWAVTMAASSGATALWSAGTPQYDFNDPTANAVDGGDNDSYGGRMTVSFSWITLTPENGCNNTGVSIWSSDSYSEWVTDSITLLSAGTSAGTNCYWDLTDISLSQTIPLEQAVASYTLSMTLTITAI